MIRRNTVLPGKGGQGEEEPKEPSTPGMTMPRRLSLARSMTKKVSHTGFHEVNEAGLTTDWDDAKEKPLFISDFPFD